MRREAATMVELRLKSCDPSHLCGLKDMEHGVEALADVCRGAGMN